MDDVAQRFLPPQAQQFLVMDRSSGVYRRSGSPFWMIRFRYKGRLIRESSQMASRREAIAYREKRMAEFGLGKGRSENSVPTLSAALEELLSHIAATGKRGYAQVRSHSRGILDHFGDSVTVAEILPGRMEGFIRARRATGLKPASVYNEMSTLRRCLRMQWKRHCLMVLPEFPMPTPGRARQGFFSAEEVERLCQHLPKHAINAVRFAWETGWRRGEIFGLRWSDVDWDQGLVVLRDSKNGEARQLPFSESEVLVRILRHQRANASGIELRRGARVDFVFQYAGRQLPEGLRRCWRSACRKAGLEGRLFHDLRRSFIQRCEDLSVSRSSAMKITGHKTEAVYARYAIAPRASLASALRNLSEQDGDKPNLRKPKKRPKIQDGLRTV